jgi:Domain of Unknown Function (DUF1080)
MKLKLLPLQEFPNPFITQSKTSNLIKKIIVIIILILPGGFSFAANPVKPISVSHPFNGKDLTGWGSLETQNDKSIFVPFDGKQESPAGRFTGKNRILAINPFDEAKGPHWVNLWTAQEYPDNFSLTLEFRASVNADSGIFLRGEQLQCRDYLVAGPYKTLKKYKPQDWNKIKVVVKNNVARCTCNGEVLEEAFPLPPTGRLGIEADRGLMEYRKIHVRILK